MRVVRYFLATAAAAVATTKTRSDPCHRVDGASKAVRLGCERLVNSRDELTRLATRRGGYLCRFVLSLLHNKRRLPSFHRAVEAACSARPHESSTRIRLVVSVQHNGLGNQLFQMAVASRLAASLGVELRTRQIRDFEGPVDDKRLPPNTLPSWRALTRLFGHQRRGEDDEACVDDMVPAKNEYEKNGTLIVAQRPADTRRQPLEVSLRRLLDGEGIKCLKLIGYFQDYGLLLPSREGDDEHLFDNFTALRDSTEEIMELQSPNDIVCHVRVCGGGGGHYQYYDYETYFEPIIRVANRTGGRIKVVTRCATGKGGVVDDLVNRAGATVVNFFREGSMVDHIAADFLYLARAEGTLIVTESSFSWWAAFLGRASVVHSPAAGALPIVHDQPRYVFHDPYHGSYFGKFDEATQEFAYSVHATQKRSSRGGS